MTDRELDALVAEKVMGPDAVKDSFRWGSPLGEVLLPPHYSTTGDGMLAVIEAMREKGYTCVIHSTKISVDEWWVKFAHVEKHFSMDDQGIGLAKCVSLAALKAVEEEGRRP